ncbi:MAG: hypothetical protein K5765_08975 [Clostridia bacterium]|nr:hypothetical protein [Clostridia bacterium]
MEKYKRKMVIDALYDTYYLGQTKESARETYKAKIEECKNLAKAEVITPVALCMLNEMESRLAGSSTPYSNYIPRLLKEDDSYNLTNYNINDSIEARIFAKYMKYVKNGNDARSEYINEKIQQLIEEQITNYYGDIIEKLNAEGGNVNSAYESADFIKAGIYLAKLNKTNIVVSIDDYIGNFGSINDKTGYNTARANIIAQTLMEEANLAGGHLTENEIQDIVNKYLNNYAMRALVYFYDNLATSEEKTIIEIIIEKEAKKNLSTDRYPIETEIIKQIKSFENISIKNIFNAIKQRADFNNMEAIEISYNYIFLTSAMDDIYYEIENESGSANWYINNTGLYTKYRAMILDLLKAATQKDSIDESEGILFNNENQELGEYIDKLVEIIVSAYYKDRVVNVNNGLYSKTEAEKTELLPSIKKQVVKMLLNDENYSEVFKSIAMKLIDKLIDQNNTEEAFYEVVYNNIRDILVEERTEQFKETILRSIEEMILNDVFNTVSLFKTTVEEYKSKMYSILTNGEIYYERDFDSLINKFITEYNRDNIDGSIYESIKNKIRTNDDKNWWDGQEIWWGKQGSSFLDDAEKEVINQLYLQCYYNTNDEIIAKINHILAIARILEERDKFFENGLEKDLVGNELKSNASFIKEIVDGNILGSETLLRAHLKGLKTQKAKEYIEDLQNPNNIIIFVNRLNTYEEYLDGMFTVLITNDAIDLNAETGIETKEYLVNTYDNILNNLKYTSCSLSKEEAQVDSGLINKYEMIKTYYNNIYQTIIGYGEIIKVETLMWVPLRWYYLEADKKYKAAIEKMGDSEISVKVTFYSEDNIEADSEESRHILMFDRTTWQEYIEAENNSIPATLNNENIYLSNKEKSEIIERENGTKEYTNAFNMDEVKFALIDINDIKLKFEGEDSLNHITIDALNPVLPSEATGYGKAVGSVGIGEENYSYLLGKVKITEYSEAFYELIYKSYEINTVEEMQAYSVRCRTYTGEIIEVTLSVTYLPREIDSLYTNEDYYSTNAEELGGTIVTGMYSLNDGNKNVVYIDPLVKDTHNDVSFLLPTEIGVRLSDENETEFLFKDVKWSVQPTYTLAGTSGQYVKINITSYTYYDSATLTNRKVDINYSTKVVTITNKKLGEETVKIFKLSDSDKYMLSWNTYIYIEDRTANKVYYNNENNLKVLLGELDSTTKKIDATGSSIRVNPYSPEYPTELTIEFNGNEDVPKDDMVSGATFTLVNSNSLITINQQPYLQGDVNRELNFDAVFKYSGFSIIVTFKAMDIKIPDVEEVDNGDGTTSKQYIQGGTLYLIANQDSANNQVRDFYNHVYYNFGTEEEPNWQKVPLHFETSTLNQISTANPNTYENVKATIGASQSGVLSQNIEFTIKVVNVDALATMESDETGFNKYVEYTYLSVPVDSKNNLRIINGAPNYIGKNFFAYDQNDGSLIEYFVGTYDSTESIATTTAKFNFVDKTVMLPISYKNNKNISNKIAFNSDGDKDVVIQYIMKMNSYVYENVKSVELNSDSTGKKWKWTSVNKESENYVDALFWPLGVSMNTDDLPTLINTDTGEEIKVYWDLSELNVNKANTQYTYVDGETKLEGGKEITGWYIGNNNIWNSIPLIVYIDKVDIHEQILAKISAELDKTSILSGEYSKEYDGQFVKIEIDLNEFSVIRENGKIEPLEGNDFTITYYEVLNESEYIEIDGYPINAGTYFVRININDYNIECVNDNRYDSLIMIYIDKTTIDLSTFKFEGEEVDSNEIELKYDGKQKSISISSGIPLVAVDNWFEPGEKEELFNKYRNVAGATDEIAKSQVYDTIYLRVSEIAQQKLTDWYDLVQRRLNTNNVITIKAGVYDEFMVYNLKIEEAVFSISYKKDGIPTQNLSDCGRYSAEVVFKEGEIGNENYVLINTKTINISIVKNEEIEYRFTSDLVVYNGTYQNPRINGINGEEGSSIPSGVIIKYTYSARDIDEYTVTYDGNYTSTKVSTSGAIITGIKDVGEYYYTVQIIGGNNYIDGVFSGTVRVIPADMYIDINNQTIEYLDDVPTIANQIVVYTSRYPEGDRDKLLENDKLSSLGTVVFTDTGINKNSPVGTYYIKILGLRADGQSVDQTFTKFASADNDKLNPYANKNSRKIEIKAGSEPGSIALDDREEYKNIIALFNNYNVYVSFIKSDGEDNESAARYTITTKSAIEGQEKVYAVDSNEELIDVLARINSNLDQEPEVSIYLTPLDNGLSYNDITINTNKRVNIIGYYDVIDSSKIATKVNSLNIIKCDMINLNILSINITTSNKTAISVGKMVGNIVIERCNITSTTLTSTFGIYTEDYYSGTMTVKQSTISNFDTAIRIHKGFLEVKNCSFYRNITDIKAEDTTTNLIVTNNLFNGSQTAINSGIYTNISIKENTFEYLYIGIQIELTINNDIYLQNTYTEVNIPVKISAD